MDGAVEGVQRQVDGVRKGLWQQDADVTAVGIVLRYAVLAMQQPASLHRLA